MTKRRRSTDRTLRRRFVRAADEDVWMSRLPPFRRDDLDDEARSLFDRIEETRGTGVVGPEGGLIGPFNAWLAAPDIGAKLAELGGTLRFGSSTGARWKAEFEWWAHARMAREHGVDDGVIAAIAVEADPPFAHDDERIVHGVARELATTGRLTDATYAAAHALLGHRGLVELVSLCGYYTLVSFSLNAFEVALPAGVAPTWDEPGRA